MSPHIDEFIASPKAKLPQPTKDTFDVQLQDSGRLSTDKARGLLFQIERAFGYSSDEAQLRLFEDIDSGTKFIAIDYDLYNIANNLELTSNAANMADQKIRQAAVESYHAGLALDTNEEFMKRYIGIMSDAETLRREANVFAKQNDSHE